MRGDVETIKVKGYWANRIQGRYRDHTDAVGVRWTLGRNLALETVKVRGKWINQSPYRYETQADAAELGKAMARTLKVEWFLKSRLGRIRERNTYTGHDPRNIKG